MAKYRRPNLVRLECRKMSRNHHGPKKDKDTGHRQHRSRGLGVAIQGMRIGRRPVTAACRQSPRPACAAWQPAGRAGCGRRKNWATHPAWAVGAGVVADRQVQSRDRIVASQRRRQLVDQGAWAGQDVGAPSARVCPDSRSPDTGRNTLNIVADGPKPRGNFPNRSSITICRRAVTDCAQAHPGASTCDEPRLS